MVASPKGLGPRKTALAKASSIYKWQTRPLVREGAPQKQDRNCQTVIHIWSWAPDGWLTDRQWQCDFDLFDLAVVRSWQISVEEEFIWVSYQELGLVLETAVEDDWEEMARKELDCVKKTSYVIWSNSDIHKSVARIRLVKAENIASRFSNFTRRRKIYGKSGYIFRKPLLDAAEKKETYDPVRDQTLNSSNIQSVAQLNISVLYLLS
jgi:hypothetical protein